MYKTNAGQASLFDDPTNFIGARLNPNNRWVQMSSMIPWDLLDEKYNAQFRNKKVGNPAKAARMALGSHIIKEKFGISDQETVEHIKESPYLQWFIGLPEFTDKAPFDASTMTWFRKRLTPEILEEVNSYIIGTASKDKDDQDQNPGGSGSSSSDSHRSDPADSNKGTLILDATCAPSDIRFPTDVSLLNEAREKSEMLILTLHRQSEKGVKAPRTYKKQARRDYLRFARSKKPTIQKIRKAIRQQLGYVRRNLKTIGSLLEKGYGLSDRDQVLLGTLETLYSQQKEMYRDRKHQVAGRIVSIHQPWIRPIVRGKTNAPVEFGAKVAISMVDGYAQIDKLDWNPFNESTTLMETVEGYRAKTGCYPARILGDKIYRTRENLNYCKSKGIHMNGPKLGRPPSNKTLYREQCLQEKSEAGERNAVESKFGEGKRSYGLGRLYAKRQDTSETNIHLVFLVMNLEKRLRVFFRPLFRILEYRIHMFKLMPSGAQMAV